jgi:O-antigen ligase
LMIWMIWQLARSRSQQVGLMTAYVLGAHVAAMGTIMLYLQQGQALRRFAAGGVDPNDLAMTLALGLPMAWYLGLIYRRPLLRLICRAYLPVGIVALGLTGSRGGMLASIVALMVVPLTLTRLSPAKLVGGIAILILSGWLAVTYTPDTIVQRLATTESEVQGGRMGGRLKLWQAGLKVFVNRPIFGWGTSSFKPAVTPILGPMSQVAHNSFISVLVEQGLVGLLLYLIMFAAVFREVLRLPPLEKRFALVLLAALLVAMLPLTWEDRKSVWFILAMLLGLSTASVASGRPVRQPWSQPAAPLSGPRPASTRPAPLATRRQNTSNPLRHDA